jgi:ParB family chromosome partitioning protein
MPDAIFHIEVDKIKSNPDQPRRVFDEGAIKELASSIREFGILQPIVVTKVEHEVPTGTEVEYILISGERRLMASKSLGLERIPAIIRAVGADRERLELAVIENIQRENLNVIEVARAMSRLQDEFRLTQREIATRLGKSREAVANTVRLLDLPPKMQEALGRGEISESHGRLLLAVDDAAVQQRLFDDLTTKSLTTRELKARVDQNRTRQTRGMRMHPTPPPAWMDVESRLSASLGAPVKISGSGESGTITIAFYSDEELSQIVEKIKKDAADQMIL